MAVLVTSNFDDDSIKNELASMATPFSHYKSKGKFLDAQGQLTPLSVVRSGPNSNLSEILCMSSLPASIKRIGSKITEKRWRHRFPQCKSMGAFCCHGNQFWSNVPTKAYATSPPPPSHPSDATDKIWSRLANWLQRYSSLKVWTMTTDHWCTISSPCEPSAQVFKSNSKNLFTRFKPVSNKTYVMGHDICILKFEQSGFSIQLTMGAVWSGSTPICPWT